MEQDINEISFKYLSPICETFKLDFDEISDDVKRHVNANNSKINASNAVLGMRFILSRIWCTDMHKELGAIDWKTVKENIYKVSRSLVSKPEEQYQFIRKVAGAQGYFMLWLLLEEMHEKEMLALE
ncbi:hypothetical protein P4U03_30160 [Bacillus mycoides]|nr:MULTISPECIES: hypothetical protein [Bacteria]YP_009218198.1 hypothetical protein XO28_0065 [Bacillus phage phi4J1]ALO79952.1 hypothetical protein XO29_0077 [Bacillus phage phiS58]MED1158367.1 hypothetical protein [Bacillus paranthracis]AIE36871.1 hypothetical protein BTK_34871 [Bacillus thuringiensis serovar kurstaki str. HD-1]ALO79861.1 hypothetical protein XO28_0065 [Bacillus phage phi4J1]MCC3876715.1 hypothetical protein [Bacillus thuringiensis]